MNKDLANLGAFDVKLMFQTCFHKTLHFMLRSSETNLSNLHSVSRESDQKSDGICEVVNRLYEKVSRTASCRLFLCW